MGKQKLPARADCKFALLWPPGPAPLLSLLPSQRGGLAASSQQCLRSPRGRGRVRTRTARDSGLAHFPTAINGVVLRPSYRTGILKAAQRGFLPCTERTLAPAAYAIAPRSRRDCFIDPRENRASGHCGRSAIKLQVSKRSSARCISGVAAAASSRSRLSSPN